MEAAMSITCENPRPVVFDSLVAVLVYVLYGVGYCTGISAFAGVIIAYIKLDTCDPVMVSHYRFQIRTFWIGLLYLTIAIPLCIVVIGIPLLLWWYLWSLIRIVKGGLRAVQHRPIRNPNSWMFG
jgi:uncharacterized membrane protein